MKTFNPLKSAAFLFLSVFLFSCGSNDAPKHQPKTHVVEIKDMKFEPDTLTVSKGDTVLWINKDIVAHDVTEKDKAWASPPLNNGESWKKEVNKSDDYYCSIHVIMTGKLIVE